MSWETVIGLEVHVQLKTESKLFCGCPTIFGAAPNTNVCPVCLGLPGALPVINDRAVRLAVRAALALDFGLHETSVFARKNYFYPDLPKGYQISQFDRPLATHGSLRIGSSEGTAASVGITRLHLEEDAGKSFHDRVPGRTAIDFNRSGIPLIEIVSEPDLRSPANARAYLGTLKQLLQYIEVSDCNMEEGSLRVDANLSVRRPGSLALGTRQEVKNMNSFAGVERALSQLRDLQIATLEAGGEVHLVTYTGRITDIRPTRTKEESHDYRYFPEPDIPPLVVSAALARHERDNIPELPESRRERFVSEFRLSPSDARVLTSTRKLANYYEAVVPLAQVSAKEVATWVMNDVLRLTPVHGEFMEPEAVADVINLCVSGTVSRQAGKKILAQMALNRDEQITAEQLAERMGVIQVSHESQLAQWASRAFAEHPSELDRLRNGEERLVDFFTGRIVRLSGGSADPKRVRELVRSEADS